ncbi:MAG: MotA/TolQ/ExbB proton channel family protein [Bryobacteraceae bacterium]
MNLLPLLENGLFALGQVLRFPVMALLWVCVAAALFMSGRCIMDFVARQRERRGFDLDKWLLGGTVLNAEENRARALPSALRHLLADVENSRAEDTLTDGGLEHLVLEYEEKVRASLTGPRTLVKVGPALGLIGTLIPMGTSLASLAGGNLEAMSGQMVVAFTSTIIGLTAGTMAYVIATVRLSWVNEAVREQRYLAERIAGELSISAVPDEELVRKIR